MFFSRLIIDQRCKSQLPFTEYYKYKKENNYGG
jgi:hypothetical protein